MNEKWYNHKVDVDCWLYVLVGTGPAVIGFLSQEDAKLFIPAFALFWMKGAAGTLATAAGLVKAYRSTSRQDRKNAEAARQGQPVAPIAAQVQTVATSTTDPAPPTDPAGDVQILPPPASPGTPRGVVN